MLTHYTHSPAVETNEKWVILSVHLCATTSNRWTIEALSKKFRVRKLTGIQNERVIVRAHWRNHHIQVDHRSAVQEVQGAQAAGAGHTGVEGGCCCWCSSILIVWHLSLRRQCLLHVWRQCQSGKAEEMGGLVALGYSSHSFTPHSLHDTTGNGGP